VTRGSARDFFETSAYLERNPILRIRAELVSDLLAGFAGGSVLDLGCGDGSISKPLATRELTLVDFSSAMIARARENVPYARHVQADVLEWEPDRTYDVVLALGLLAHVASPDRLLGNVASALVPGGRCVLQITDAGRPLGWFLSRHGRLRQRDGYRLNELTEAELVARAKAHDLHAVASRRYGLLLPGTGRLPRTWHGALERRFASEPLSRLAADVLVLFEKRGSS
jgi:2-polyprenyl-3-methyl-5-hydroxy-6-metoxy-1,4-benzoquinol methylase